MRDNRQLTLTPIRTIPTNSDNIESETPLEDQTSGDSSNQINGHSSASNTTFAEKLQNLGQNLAENQRHLENEENGNTVVNLQYCGQGVNSGMITVETAYASNSLSSAMNEESNSNDNNVEIADVFHDSREVNEEMANSEDNNDVNENISNDLGVEEEDNESVPTTSGDKLFRSFDDVLKHLKEERDYERSQLPNVSIPVVKQRYTGHRNARTMVSFDPLITFEIF